MVLPQSIIERCRFPCISEEDHAYSLPKIVELQAGSTNRGHDRSIMDASNRDFELSCTKDKVGMGGRSATS